MNRKQKIIPILLFNALISLSLSQNISADTEAGADKSHQKGLSFVPEIERKSFMTEEKVAVVIGLSDYPSLGGLNTPEYADDDAMAMAKQLNALGYKVRTLTQWPGDWRRGDKLIAGSWAIS